MPKRFMYASAGVLMLVLAIHLGAAVAGTYGAECVDVAHISNTAYGPIIIATKGMVQRWELSGNNLTLVEQVPLPRNGVVADASVIGYGNSYGVFVAYRDGEIHVWHEGSWHLQANACSVVPIQPSTWGQIKHRAGREGDH